MTEDEAFAQALAETMPPMDEAGKLRWWFAKGAAAEREACAQLCETEHPHTFARHVAEHIRARSNAEVTSRPSSGD